MIQDNRLGNTPRWYLNEPKDYHMRVPDEVRKCVVFLTWDRPVGDHFTHEWRGSAFLMSVPSERLPHVSYTYLVSAAHLFPSHGRMPFYVEVNMHDGQRREIGVGTALDWVRHPTDQTIDVAVLPWGPPSLEYDHTRLPVSMLLPDTLLEGNHPYGPESVGLGDEIFLSGLFAPAGPKANNVPIIRMGNIAMLPSGPVQVSEELDGESDVYLVEVHSLTAMSGSPVFVRATVPGGTGSLYLLGAMRGHWQTTAGRIGEIQIDDPDSSAPRLHTGIGLVTPAKKILEVLNQQALIEQRAQKDADQLRRNLPVMDSRAE